MTAPQTTDTGALVVPLTPEQRARWDAYRATAEGQHALRTVARVALAIAARQRATEAAADAKTPTGKLHTSGRHQRPVRSRA